MSIGILVRLGIVAVIGATLLSGLDVTLGVEIVDQAIDLLDLTQYL